MSRHIPMFQSVPTLSWRKLVVKMSTQRDGIEIGKFWIPGEGFDVLQGLVPESMHLSEPVLSFFSTGKICGIKPV